jgi:hypothetical protein
LVLGFGFLPETWNQKPETKSPGKLQLAGAFGSPKSRLKAGTPHKLPGNEGIIMLIIMEDGNMLCIFAGRK